MAQRQFRSDDTSQWQYGFGNGSDGAYSSGGNATDAPIDSACSGTGGTTSLTATNASFAPGQLILIHQTRGTNAGKWELNKISAYVAGTITTESPLINTYANSGADIAQVLVLKQYSSFIQNSGHTLTAKAWNGTVGGIIAFLCSGAVNGSGNISLDGKGYLGGSAPSGTNGGFRGEGTTADNSVAQTTANGNGGGGGSGAAGVAPGGGGGGHSATASGGENQEGVGGTAGASAGVANLVTMVMGGGAGAGGSSADNSGTRSAGGAGAGLLLIIGKNIDVSSLTVTLGGTNGGTATNRNGRGGGGAGGSALLKGQTIVLGTNKITAPAGASGSGGTGGAGGAGATGRIHADYLTSISGTTNPTIDSTQDPTLVYPASFLLMF